MAEETATIETGPAEATDNPIAWFEARASKTTDAPVAAAVPAPETAAPVAPEPVEDPAEPWWDQGLAETKHGFLKNRKGPEVEKAFRSTQTAMQEAQRERNELRAQLDQSRAEVAARNAVLQAEIARRSGTAQEPAVNPEDELEHLLFTNPKEYTRRVKEDATNEAKRIVETERQQYEQKTTEEAQHRDLTVRGDAAWKGAGVKLGIPPDVWLSNELSIPIMVALTNPELPYCANGGPLNEDNYVAAYRDLQKALGMSMPAAVVAPIVPAQTTPPGSRKPATATATNSGQVVSEDSRKRAESLAAIGGINPEKLAARMARRHRNA